MKIKNEKKKKSCSIEYKYFIDLLTYKKINHPERNQKVYINVSGTYVFIFYNIKGLYAYGIVSLENSLPLFTF